MFKKYINLNNKNKDYKIQVKKILIKFLITKIRLKTKVVTINILIKINIYNNKINIINKIMNVMMSNNSMEIQIAKTAFNKFTKVEFIRLARIDTLKYKINNNKVIKIKIKERYHKVMKVIFQNTKLEKTIIFE